MANTWIWISGWGICPKRFKTAVESALPDYSHQVVAPTPNALETVLTSGTDRIGGYSLGSLILLSALEQFQEAANITCTAPFITFCKEDQLGGTTPKATLRSLQQRLRKQPEKTLQLFYRLAGLKDEPTDRLPYAIEHLEWGLEQLANLRANINLLNHAKGLAGLTDSLIDYKVIQTKWEKCHFVGSLNHNYHPLLIALSKIDLI